jgi:hypothetical protein
LKIENGILSVMFSYKKARKNPVNDLKTSQLTGFKITQTTTYQRVPAAVQGQVAAFQAVPFVAEAERAAVAPADSQGRRMNHHMDA